LIRSEGGRSCWTTPTAQQRPARPATDLYRITLAARERILGPDHPHALWSRNNLALALGSLGDHRQAAELHRTILASYERVLGPDHPETVRSRNNLARAEAALRHRPWLRLRRSTNPDPAPPDPARVNPPASG
jgi:hypothetical protein